VQRDDFFEEGTRVLTPQAFDFVLDGELKRAVRSQSFLTLVVLETRRAWDGLSMDADQGTVAEVARIIGHEVRDTDLLGASEHGRLLLALLDADVDSTRKIIDRLVQRIDHYEFPAPLHISMGAACYPIHAVDADSLKERAQTRPAVSWRGGPGIERRN
jgi:GGDEF domain-containing protein